MKSANLRNGFAFAVPTLTFLFACSFDPWGKSCDAQGRCLPGYVCDPSSNRCVFPKDLLEDGAALPDGGDSGPDAEEALDLDDGGDEADGAEGADAADVDLDGGDGGPDAWGGDGGAPDGSCAEPVACDVCRPGECCVVDCIGPCPACPAGCGCDFGCQAQTDCSGRCDAASRCEFTVQSGHTAGLDCDGAACDFVCQQVQTCSMTCDAGATCSLACSGTHSCQLDCRDTSACLLDCGDAKDCALLCPAPLTCADKLLACNRSCP